MNANDRANELYWGSDQSVNQIADDLDLSKGALYEMIRPLPAGLGCPLCGAEVVHPNRTAQERGRVDCPECGWDGTEDEAIGDAVEAAETIVPPKVDSASTWDAGDEIYPANDFDAPGPPPAAVGTELAENRRLVLGGALLGAAVGLALVIWARRK